MPGAREVVWGKCVALELELSYSEMSTSGRRSTGTDPTESSPLLASTPSAAPSSSHNDVNDHDEADLTHFPPGSPLNPRNWPSWRKWLIVAAITPTDLSVSWAASGFSPAEGNFADEFGVGEEVARLGLSLYVLGIALGPMFLAPLSEVLGRNSMCESRPLPCRSGPAARS